GAARAVDQYTQQPGQLPHDRAALEGFARDRLPQADDHPVRAYGSLLQFAGRGGDSQPGPADVAWLLGLFPAEEHTPELARLLTLARELAGRELADSGEARYLAGLVLLSDELYPGDAFPVEELTGQRRR